MHKYANALTNDSLAAAAASLAERDRHLRAIYQRHGPPPMWARRPGFDTLLHILLEQQVSLVSARSMYNRLRSSIDPFDPLTFIDCGEEHLRTLGMTRQKAHYAIQIAQAFSNGSLKSLRRMNDETAFSTLTEIKGVGPWTANIYLLMALRRPDIWPDGDLALASSVSQLRRLKERPSVGELARLANRWRPYRSVAARMLWQYYLARRGPLPTSRNH